MTEPTRRFLLGFLSGSLVTLGFGLVLVYGLVGWFLHHMFIIGVHSVAGLLWFLFPAILIAAGLFVGIRSIIHGVQPEPKRQALGMLFLLLPVFIMSSVPFFGVLFGSLGMDIHWNASKSFGYASAFCLALILCGSLLLGWRLLRYEGSPS